MPYIVLGIILAVFTFQPIVDGGKICLPFFVINVDHAFSGKEHGVAAIARWHDAVEHINTQGNAFEYVPWRADTHQVTRSFLSHMFAAKLADLVHHRFRLTNAEAANSIARCLFRADVGT